MLTKILPPGPKEAFNLNADEASFQLMGRLFVEFGDIVCLHNTRNEKPDILINHPDYIKQVFVSEYRSFKKGTGFDRVKILLGNGLIVSDGEFWARQKRMIQPIFHKNILRQVYEIMCQCNVNLLGKWITAAGSNTPINVTKDTCYLALEIILRALFSEDYETLSDDGASPFFILAEHTGRDLDLVVKFHALKKYVKQCMHDRLENDRFPDDFLSMLMLSEDKVTQQHMTENEVLDEVMTLIVAAHETTAATVNWVWYYLSENQDVMTKVLDEIDPLSDEPLDFEMLSAVPYIKQVIDEALRIYPPGWLLSREALQEFDLGEYTLEPGTNVFVSPYYIHRHPDFWQRPAEFDPERFNKANVKNVNRYTYFPFSMGQRRCPGEMFALIEIQMHIAYVCKHLKLKYIDEKPIVLEPLINLRSEHDFYMQASVVG